MRYHIYDFYINTLSEESLRYRTPWEDLNELTKMLLEVITDFFKGYRNAIMYKTERKEIFDISNGYITGKRVELGLRERLDGKFEDSFEFEKLTGLVFNANWKSYGIKVSANETPYQIQNLRLVSRVGPDGNQIIRKYSQLIRC